jgi:hypothetical protein
MTNKACSKCGIMKDLSDFSNDKSKIDGKYNSCKDCKKLNDENYRIRNIDYIRTKHNEIINIFLQTYDVPKTE